MSDPPRWLIGQRVAWLGSGSGLPRTATARWIGRLPGMGAGWTVGIELDEALPLGGVDGKWAGHRLFHCKRSHGLFVPLASVIPESDLRTRAKQGLGETLWLKELEDEFREIRDETLKRIKDKEERKKVKNEARKEAETNGAESKKELVTPTDIPKEESVIETQKGKNSVPPVKDEEEQEVYGVYQWYDAIDHTVGECQGPVVEHLYEEEFSGKIGDQPRAMAVKAETPFPPALPSQPDKDYSKEGDEARAEEDRLTAQLTLPKGLAKFKASLVPEDEGNLTDLEASGRLNPDTLAVARLLRRLEAAIAGGQHESAAVLARQLARLKINCSVTRHANNRRSLMGSPRESSVEGGPSSAASSTSGSTKITIDMYVEDKVSHLGPIPVVVSTSMTVGELKTRVEQDFEIPVNVQRWIIGRRLASNDSLTLLQHDVTSNGTPVFLYLVAPGDSEASASGNASAKDSKSSKGSEKGEEPDMSEFKKAEEESAPAAPEERMIAKPVDEMPRGRGWYYNFEEDRYSYCSDSDSDAEEVEQPRTIAEAERTEVVPERETVKTAEPRRSVIIQNGVRLIMQEDEYDDEEEFIDGEEVEEEEYVEEVIEEVEEEEEEIEEEEVEEEEVEEEEVEEEEVEEEDEEEDVAGAIGGAHHVAISPREHQTTPSINKPDLPPEDKTNTLKLGWKCPLCTLVNPPTRPGCAACASERPATYRLPSNYKAGRAEAERLDKEEKSQMAQQEAKKNEEDEKKRDYERLLHLEKSELVPNAEEFTCPVCFVDSAPNEGVTLRDCLHTFCRLCLVNTIQFSEEAEVKCPYRDDDYACDSTLQDREIRALVPADVYEQLLARSMALAEKKMGAQAFHCKTPDCKGWCVLEDNINVFPCPVCRRTNCLTCQAIHDGLNCKQYQEGLNKESETNADAKRTKDMLE